MASAPSASALSAVLRCRRNLWTAPSARLTGSTARDLPVQTASLWDALTRGERLVLGRLALTCHVPWKRRARTDGHARPPLCTRISVRAHRAKVVFVCDSDGGRTRLDPSDRVSMTSPLSRFVLVNLRVLFRPGTGPGREGPQSPAEGAVRGAMIPAGARIPAEGAVRGARIPAEGAVQGAKIPEDKPD